MRAIDLLTHYFTSDVIEKFIINTCLDRGFNFSLPISPECSQYFNQELFSINDAYSFLVGSFPWYQNDAIDWVDVIDNVIVEIKKNGLPMDESIKPLKSMERFKFIK